MTSQWECAKCGFRPALPFYPGKDTSCPNCGGNTWLLLYGVP